jgi:hypothetical protein
VHLALPCRREIADLRMTISVGETIREDDRAPELPRAQFNRAILPQRFECDEGLMAL